MNAERRVCLLAYKAAVSALDGILVLPDSGRLICLTPTFDRFCLLYGRLICTKPVPRVMTLRVYHETLFAGELISGRKR